MADGYLHDIFISYRHAGPAHAWVTKYFFPLLKKWLPEFMPYDYIISEESIFIDIDIETGSSWPIRLTEALQTSRCLLPVWSPSYFRSNWCLAELHTMLEREKIFGMRAGGNSSGIVYPVRFVDSPHSVPSKYSTIQYRDVSKWGIDEPGFGESREYLELVHEVKQICKELWPIIQSAPKWQDNWPVVLPEPLPDPAFPLPRFS